MVTSASEIFLLEKKISNCRGSISRHHADVQTTGLPKRRLEITGLVIWRMTGHRPLQGHCKATASTAPAGH